MWLSLWGCNPMYIHFSKKRMSLFFPLNMKEYHIIDQVRTLYQARHRIPCTDCRYCVDFCPMGIPIPTVFPLMNRKLAGEGQPEQDYAALGGKVKEIV